MLLVVDYTDVVSGPCKLGLYLDLPLHEVVFGEDQDMGIAGAGGFIRHGAEECGMVLLNDIV